jgi:dimethylhistidine N-methyltransferase
MMQVRLADRYRAIRVPAGAPEDEFAGAVGRGLGAKPRSLPCRFFYDTAGSRLFERICELPEYYPTRTEEGILRAHAREIIESVGEEVALAEFGSGDSRKTRILIEALLERQARLAYAPIDISIEYLEASARALLEQYRRLWLTAIGGEYLDAVRHLPRHTCPRLIVFLGGNIGNMQESQAVAFLALVRREMGDRDRLLVGYDRLKAPDILRAAYNDAAGITAAFNKNLLARINRELRGEFNLDAFAHDAPFVEAYARIEMHLVSLRDQTVRVAALGRSFGFSRHETIHTENSHKYEPEQFARLAAASGLIVTESWSDAHQWFSLALLARDVPRVGAPQRCA